MLQGDQLGDLRDHLPRPLNDELTLPDHPERSSGSGSVLAGKRTASDGQPAALIRQAVLSARTSAVSARLK